MAALYLVFLAYMVLLGGTSGTHVRHPLVLLLGVALLEWLVITAWCAGLAVFRAHGAGAFVIVLLAGALAVFGYVRWQHPPSDHSASDRPRPRERALPPAPPSLDASSTLDEDALR